MKRIRYLLLCTAAGLEDFCEHNIHRLGRARQNVPYSICSHVGEVLILIWTLFRFSSLPTSSYLSPFSPLATFLTLFLSHCSIPAYLLFSSPPPLALARLASSCPTINLLLNSFYVLVERMRHFQRIQTCILTTI